MPKRAAVKDASAAESPPSSASSPLSSPPNSDLDEPAPLVPPRTTVTVVGRKRVKKEVQLDADGSTDIKLEEQQSIEVTTTQLPPKQKKPRQKKVKVEELDEDGQPKPKKRRKTKEEREAELMPLAARTPGLVMFVGAHVSITSRQASMAKGIHNAVLNSTHIGGNAFALFLKSQRKWESPALKDEDAKKFVDMCRTEGYDAKRHILPHGSYLVNLGQADPEKAKQAYEGFVDDLKRCEKLGIGRFNFHPGSTNGNPRPETLQRIAKAINKAHKETKFVNILLENRANRGNTIAGAFEDLREIIALVDDKKRVGVCLDTCHAFAAGYDLRTPAAFSQTLKNFDEVVGLKYLYALHLNDSKAPFNSERDLHENVGLGFLGLSAFRNIMNCKAFEGLPLILETPNKEEKVWADEIKLLEGLIGVEEDDEAYLAKAKELSDQGADARKIMQDKYDEKLRKAAAGVGRKRKEKKDGDIGKMFGAKAKLESEDEGDSDSGRSSCAGDMSQELSEEDELEEEKPKKKSRAKKAKKESEDLDDEEEDVEENPKKKSTIMKVRKEVIKTIKVVTKKAKK